MKRKLKRIMPQADYVRIVIAVKTKGKDGAEVSQKQGSFSALL